MGNKRILLISSEFPPGPGGIGQHAYDVARALDGKGYKISVMASQDFSDEKEIEDFNKQHNENYTITRFKRTGISTYYNRWRLINNFLKKEFPDKIIVTGRFSLWMGYLIKLKYGDLIPVHAFIHGSELSHKNKFFYFLTRKSLQSFQYLWAVSSFTSNLIKEHVKRTDIKVLPNGLWFDDWDTDKFPAENVKLKGHPALLTVGQLSRRKGQHRVIKALPKIQITFPEAHYHLVGIPTDKELLLSIAHQINAHNRITIHGRIPSQAMLKLYYEATQIFIMLSENQSDGDSEGFGIAILEANYFGKPAIGAKGCGIEDAIEDGYNGRLVDGNNSAEIIVALKDIIDNYSDYSIRAKKWAKKHDWRELINLFEQSKGVDDSAVKYFKS